MIEKLLRIARIEKKRQGEVSVDTMMQLAAEGYLLDYLEDELEGEWLEAAED